MVKHTAVAGKPRKKKGKELVWHFALNSLGWLVALIFGVLILLSVPGREFTVLVVEATPPPPKYTEKELKTLEFMEYLANHEACDKTKKGYIIDSNGLPSIGKYCYQERTWDYLSDKYDFTGDVWNPEHQEELTFKALTDNRNHWRLWFNSSLKIQKLGVVLPR